MSSEKVFLNDVGGGIPGIVYHLTILPPRLPKCDAVVQEVEALRRRFGGSIIYLNPNRDLPLNLPRLTFGFHRLGQLRHLERTVQLHHLFNPDPFPFPILRTLRRPIIYSLTGGVEENRRLNVPFLAALPAITVTDERSLKRLQAFDLDNVHLVPPGIDTSRFSCSPLPLRSEVKLMVGSAPWNRAQFESKGIDALLSAARSLPQLHLVFLWRGVLVEELRRRVCRLNLEDRVEILNREVDVNQVLARVHASIALAKNPAVIRPYPHSLIESLVAGKPILVSKSIPMADYVKRTGCGRVVEHVDESCIRDVIEILVEDYADLQGRAGQIGRDAFSQERTMASYRAVYEQVLEHTQNQSTH